MSTRKKQSTSKAEAVVYCGPNIKGVAKQYTTYIGDLPIALTAKAEEIPAIRSLLVPLSSLAYTRLRLAQANSTESVIFNKIQKSL